MLGFQLVEWWAYGVDYEDLEYEVEISEIGGGVEWVPGWIDWN